jgi:CRISPR-associated protein Cst2
MAKSLTLSAVFQANSLNYGEGTANISELKKFHRGNGKVYTFASRQSLRYDIVRMGNEMFGWNLNTVDKSKQVIQFKEEVTIEDSVEMDLFGYLKTGSKSKKRSAVARLSHALSLEPYNGDMEFLNNMGLAERIGETPNLANLEQHQSHYAYHLTVDLHKVGVDGDIVLPLAERVQRVHQLLDILKLLYRDIKGRRENLSPLLVIGGVYDSSNPHFMGHVQIHKSHNGWNLDVSRLADVMKLTWNGKSVGESTAIGVVSGWIANEDELRTAFTSRVLTVEDFFARVKRDVEQGFGA